MPRVIEEVLPGSSPRKVEQTCLACAHARSSVPPVRSGPVREFLAFVLAGELYGVGSRAPEILIPPPLTVVPPRRAT